MSSANLDLVCERRPPGLLSVPIAGHATAPGRYSRR